MKQLSDLVQKRETIVVGRHATVLEAARLMGERRIGAVPVMGEGRVVGILSERDIMTRVVAAGLEPSRTRVADVMTTSLIVADAADTYARGLHLMQHANVRHLLVLKDGAFIGIISVRDLLAIEMNEKDEAINLLSAYVSDVPLTLGR